ncbi:MAG: hypothetical protein R3336_01135 [Phycisphaeraceae bacterium]|nr:hypothetical protein [Phycisphaeraceae bacterium]
MQDQTPGWISATYAILILTGLGLTVWGVMEFRKEEGEALLLATGLLCTLIPLALFPVARLIAAQGSDSSLGIPYKLEKELEKISERLLISDAAKRIAYRENDREALRDAIREDIEKQDYDAAMVLVKEMQQTYGYREEAEEFREEIEAAREAGREQKITEAIARIDELLAEQKWDKAAAEAGKVQRLYQESPRVEDLVRRTREAKEAHKHRLERQFLEAAKRDDVETAMNLLKELDQYLTEEEAAPYLETARGVITKKRDNLGVQFKLAISDKDWRTALQTGEQIINEFPKSKMADEFREIRDDLRERATNQPDDDSGSGEYEAMDDESPSSSPSPADTPSA